MKNKFKFLATMLIGILLSTNVWGAVRYDEVAWSDITSGDTVLVVSVKSGYSSTYYLMVQNGTSAPGLASITPATVDTKLQIQSFTANTEFIAEVNDAVIKFRVSGKTTYLTGKNDTGSGTIQMNNTSSSLYQSFTYESNRIAYALSSSTNYMGRYSTTDWRAYASPTHSNFADNKIIFFRKYSAPAEPRIVTFDKGTGICSTTSLTETASKSGVLLPTASPSIGCAAAGWAFAGWATSSVQTETTTAPTLFQPNTIYYPSANCTLYAVYSLSSASPVGPEVGTVLWSEAFSGESLPSGTTGYGAAAITYSSEGASQRSENYAGGTSPEILLNGTFTASGIPTGGATTMRFSYNSNKTKNDLSVAVSTGTCTNVADNTSSPLVWKINVPENTTTFNLTFSCSSNSRIDDILLEVAAPDATYNSNPTCAAPVRISWRVQSDQYAADEVNTQVTIVPANPDPAEYSCGENAVFVGWTTSDNYSNHSTAPTPLYKTAEEIRALVLTEDITFYAVFATKVIN